MGIEECKNLEACFDGEVCTGKKYMYTRARVYKKFSHTCVREARDKRDKRFDAERMVIDFRSTSARTQLDGRPCVQYGEKWAFRVQV